MDPLLTRDYGVPALCCCQLLARPQALLDPALAVTGHWGLGAADTWWVASEPSSMLFMDIYVPVSVRMHVHSMCLCRHVREGAQVCMWSCTRTYVCISIFVSMHEYTGDAFHVCACSAYPCMHVPVCVPVIVSVCVRVHCAGDSRSGCRRVPWSF